ncbi:MAG: PEP/pyruvate-binding domain-containing protein [Bacteriovoracaceae bacterium]
MNYQLFNQAVGQSEMLSDLGNKAKNLIELSSIGFPVPKGFVLTEFSLDEVRLKACLQEIGGFPVAVRSSGALEDLEGASFAGLYETFLNIKSEDVLIKAIKDCFESVHHSRVKDYFEQKGIDPSLAKMSVIVQKQIQSKISGVLFTVHPLEGREEQIYIECCEGLGERLVSGHVTPSLYKIHRDHDTILEKVINNEKTEISADALRELRLAAIGIQAYYGTPQDIEWAIDENDKLWILQARPITEFKPRTDVPELTDSDLKDGGISARVCTPLMYSAYQLALQPSMGGYFERIKLLSQGNAIQWMFYFYGRGYWNAEAVKVGLARLPDFNEEDFDKDLGILKDYGLEGPQKTKLTLTSLIHAVPVLINIWKEFDECELMTIHFPLYFKIRNDELLTISKKISTLDQSEFRNWFTAVLRLQRQAEMNYFRTIYNNTNYQGEFKRFVLKLKGADEQSFVKLISGVEDIAHMQVQKDLVKLSKIADMFGIHSNKYHEKRQEFLASHYHHGPAELDLTVPRWGDDPSMVDELVKNVHESEQSHDLYHQEVDKLLDSNNILKRFVLKRFIHRSHRFLKKREEFRTYSTMGYFLLRKGVLELAERLKIDSHHLMMLKLDEIEKVIRRDHFELNENEIISMKHQWSLYLGWRNFKAPHEFGGSIKQAKIAVNADGVYKGLGCSPGLIEGIARVIKSIDETHSLGKGEILVTEFTDPGWTPVLARVGGVITEVGGILSHAAVIGREYKIPAILNLSGATQLIKDGQRIRINGETGVVEILKESP